MGKFQALRVGGLTAFVVGCALGCGGTIITSSDVDGGGGSSATGGTKATGGTSTSGGAGGSVGGFGGTVSGAGGTGGTSSSCTNPVTCYEKCTCAGASPSTCLTRCSGNTCGNGIIEGREECDGTALNGETCVAATMGAEPNGTLRCTASCTFDTTGCTSSTCLGCPVICGDGVIEAGEECDGLAFNGQTCATATMGALLYGTLKCTPTCLLDTTGCTSGAVCSNFGDSPSCQTCLDANCCGQVKSCYADSACAWFVQCARACPNPNDALDPCVQICASGPPSTAISEWSGAVLCMENSCPTLCTHL